MPPRILKAQIGWWFSCLIHVCVPTSSSSAGYRWSAVGFKYGAIRSRAARTSLKLGTTVLSAAVCAIPRRIATGGVLSGGMILDRSAKRDLGQEEGGDQSERREHGADQECPFNACSKTDPDAGQHLVREGRRQLPEGFGQSLALPGKQSLGA